MKPKRKQKRYTKQFELDVAIIKLKRLAERKERKALELDAEYHTYNTMATDPESPPHLCLFNADRAALFRKRVETLRQQINGITIRRIPRLVRAKAELATRPMAFIADDAGVAV